MKETRRERLRRTTMEEIKALAWQQLGGGSAEINLHEVARQMGLTPPALYRYFKNRQELIVALMRDSLEAYRKALETARDSRPASDPAGRLYAVSLAWRDWAVGHPAAFGLFTRRDLPGYAPTQDQFHTIDEEIRSIFLDLLETAWRSGSLAPAGAYARLSSTYRQYLEKTGGRLDTALPPEVLHAGLSLWGMIHGLVSVEISGRFSSLMEDPGTMFKAQVMTGLRLLGMEPATDQGDV